MPDFDCNPPCPYIEEGSTGKDLCMFPMLTSLLISCRGGKFRDE